MKNVGLIFFVRLVTSIAVCTILSWLTTYIVASLMNMEFRPSHWNDAVHVIRDIATITLTIIGVAMDMMHISEIEEYK